MCSIHTRTVWVTMREWVKVKETCVIYIHIWCIAASIKASIYCLNREHCRQLVHNYIYFRRGNCNWNKYWDEYSSGVARGVAGVAEATPIFQFLFNRFGQKISVKKILLTAGYTNLKNLPTSLIFRVPDWVKDFPQESHL